jgi:hypothetical protein
MREYQRLHTATGAVCSVLLLTAIAGSAAAFTVALAPAAPNTIYLQVGVGSFSGNYTAGGLPGNNATINRVTVAVPAAAVGNSTARAMASSGGVTTSFYNGTTFCPAGQLYIGGFYRTTGAASVPLVTATVPAALTDATGDSIPFSKIGWVASGVGALPFPSGTFVNGGTQSVGSMASNTWSENCWSFSYLNNTVPPSGTYNGRVSYTLSAP